MKPQEKARRATEKSLGYLQLAIMTKERGGDPEPMRRAAIEAMEIFNDDDFIDALYDADMEDIEDDTDD